MTRSPDGGEVPASGFSAQPGSIRSLDDVGDILDLVIRARAGAEDLDLEHSRVGDLTGVLAFDLDIALDHAVSLTRNPTVEDLLTLTCDLDRALTLHFDLDRVDQRRLVADLERARRLTNELAGALVSTAGAAAAATRPADARVGRLSLGMVQLAVWVLPAAHQPRYSEEFRAELAAMDELPRRMQLAYALRQLARSWSLRRALAGG
ncbi:MAG TPA: hypothetical protein VHH34_00395 [Pseudonocardiaceae bacterium]|nr:hypothetical protein [Pseudonocardiaceae bacterium]